MQQLMQPADGLHARGKKLIKCNAIHANCHAVLAARMMILACNYQPWQRTME
jgi:hypothetical protein